MRPRLTRGGIITNSLELLYNSAAVPVPELSSSNLSVSGAGSGKGVPPVFDMAKMAIPRALESEALL
jgi:hypothetical protein